MISAKIKMRQPLPGLQRAAEGCSVVGGGAAAAEANLFSRDSF
jgi:hypothetical protein